MDHIFWLVSIFIFVSVNELVLGAKLFYNHLLSIRSFVWASVKESFVIYVYYLYSSKPSANKETVGYVLLLQIGIFCVGDKRTAPPPQKKKIAKIRIYSYMYMRSRKGQFWKEIKLMKTKYIKSNFFWGKEVHIVHCTIRIRSLYPLPLKLPWTRRGWWGILWTRRGGGESFGQGGVVGNGDRQCKLSRKILLFPERWLYWIKN